MPRLGLAGAPGPERPGGEIPPPSRRTSAIFQRLAVLQVARPAAPLIVIGLITLVAVLLAPRLRVLTGFESLLPETRPSVQELHRVAAKTTGVSTLFIVLEGSPDTSTESLRRTADALVPALAKLGPPWVGSVESGVHEARQFLGPRAGLFADRDKLEQLKERVDARYEYEVGKAAG